MAMTYMAASKILALVRLMMQYCVYKMLVVDTTYFTVKQYCSILSCFLSVDFTVKNY